MSSCRQWISSPASHALEGRDRRLNQNGTADSLAHTRRYEVYSSTIGKADVLEKVRPFSLSAAFPKSRYAFRRLATSTTDWAVSQFATQLKRHRLFCPFPSPPFSWRFHFVQSPSIDFYIHLVSALGCNSTVCIQFLYLRQGYLESTIRTQSIRTVIVPPWTNNPGPTPDHGSYVLNQDVEF